MTTEPTIQIPVRFLTDMPSEALGEIIWTRIQDSIDTLDNGARKRAAEKLGEFFASLGPADLAAFFRATDDLLREPSFGAKPTSAKPAPKPTPKSKPAAKPAPKRTREVKQCGAVFMNGRRCPKPNGHPGMCDPPPATASTNDPLWDVPAKDPKQPELFDDDIGPAGKPRADDTIPGPLEADHRNAILDFLRSNPGPRTALEIRESARLSEGQAKGLLKRMREHGTIRVDGKNRGAKYSLAGEASNGAAAHA